LANDSDICRTSSVSGVDDQTRDSSIVVYNAKKYDVIGLRKCVSFQDRKSLDHDDWWNVYGTDRSYLAYDMPSSSCQFRTHSTNMTATAVELLPFPA